MSAMPAFLHVSILELLLVGTGLSLAAIAMPLPLYVLALSLFGLPHVLWEMNWVRHTYGRSIPRQGWWLLLGILLVQAGTRLAVWFGWVTAEVTLWVDVLTLVVLLWVAAGLVYHYGGVRAWLVALFAVLLGAALLVAVQTENLVIVLTLLAIAHNFTPLFLVLGQQQFGTLPSRRVLPLLFSLPLWVMAIVWLMGVPDPVATGLWMPGEAYWLQQFWAEGFNAALSGLILAQCLHYYTVLRLLPTTLEQGMPWPWWLGAGSLSVLLAGYFWMDFTSARSLYSVAAGMHAWLEFPLICLLLSGAVVQQAKQGAIS